MIKKLFKYRFLIFFTSQLSILFGSLIFPPSFFEEVLVPILFLINIASGILMISKTKVLFWLYSSLFIISLVVYGLDIVQRNDVESNFGIRLVVYFIFYASVSISIIRQVWRAKRVNRNVIVGLMSGYISLGFIAFFMFSSIELYQPGSFAGITEQGFDLANKLDSLLYYAYITMLTIGYGDIVPIAPIAQKAAILVGLMGQFYTVIITAVVVEKYIKHSSKD
ncbi:ion channel [Pseudotenacibaculum haliotis]|uniref:Ion channel n=1 Tax=Pseudotenacibaculum haliotis TaxID=1862138 RepID=A0ABW5LX29_9FLAO